MATNRTSLSSPTDIHSILEDVSPSSPFASSTARPHSGESLLFLLSEGGDKASESLLESLKTGISGKQNVKDKQYSCIYISDPAISGMCCGFIGTHKKVFCLKSKSECDIYMKGGNHAYSRFSPDPDSIYICKSKDNTSAWCDVTCSLTKEAWSVWCTKLDFEETWSLDEWKVKILASDENRFSAEEGKTLSRIS